MARDIATGVRGLEGAELFHGAVTAVVRSSLLTDLMGAISGAIRERRLESLSQPERPGRSLTSHRKIADAIHAQKEEAADATREHIPLVSDVALLRDA